MPSRFWYAIRTVFRKVTNSSHGWISIVVDNGISGIIRVADNDGSNAFRFYGITVFSAFSIELRSKVSETCKLKKIEKYKNMKVMRKFISLSNNFNFIVI